MTLRLNAYVVDLDIQGVVVLSNGYKFFTDLVVAADRLYSGLRQTVLNKNTRQPSLVRKTHISAFGFLVDTEILLGEPDLAASLERKGPRDAAILLGLEEISHKRSIANGLNGSVLTSNQLSKG